MHILLTGGTGLIGSVLLKKLRNQHAVTVLTRNPTKAYKKLGHDITVINDLDSLNDLNHIDAIINLAGEPIADKRWSDAQKKRIEQSRWQLTDKLTALCKASSEPPHTFISGSAIGYYGAQGQTRVTEEDNQPRDEFTHRLCATWEQKAQAAATEHTRVCLLRTGIVLAPRGGALQRMSLPFKFGMGGPIGSGEQMMSWIHIDDMVDLILHLLHKDSCRGPYNATAPNPVSNEDFSKTLGKVLHRPVLLRVPSFAMKIMLGEMSTMLLNGQAVIPERTLESGFQFRHATLEDALRHCF
ncbi:TIGR01777 family oxidoreductase [Aliidiomarina sp. Khilg15.8]